MIFISYRREDTKAEVTHLAQRLRQRYGMDSVFVDFGDIPPGAHWPDTLRAQLESAQAVLGVIGARWGEARFPPGSGKKAGRLRLDDEGDWVRQELCTAFRSWQNKTLTFIVLAIDDAKLPETGWNCELDHLPLVQQAQLRNQRDFEHDFVQLCQALEASIPGLLAAASSAADLTSVPRSAVPIRFGHAAAHCRRFIHSKVSESDWLPYSLQNPYLPPLDPTDELASAEPLALQCFAWMPSSEYFGRPAIDDYTPVVLLCLKQGTDLDAELRLALPPAAYAKLELPPSKLFNEDKAIIFPAIGAALQKSFLTAVTIPKSLLAGAANHPSIGYQTILDLVVVPLLGFHIKLRIRSLTLMLPPLGEANAYVLSQTKRMTKAMLGRHKIAHHADIAAADAMAIRVCRAVAWCASRHYNRNDSQWIELLESGLNKVDATQSRME